MLSKRNRIVIVTGGYGPERDTSLASGRVVASILTDRGYRTWSYVANDRELPDFPRFVDMAFLTVRGRFGSGPLQKFMIDHEIPFTGSDASTCRLVFDKRSTRRRLRAGGLPTPRESSWKGSAKLPSGKILHAVVLGHRVLPLVDEEIDSSCLADLSSSDEVTLRRYALSAFNSVGCNGYASVRLMIGAARHMVLDIDPVPSFERGSPLRRALSAAGMKVEECCEKILEEALCAIPKTGIRMAG